jgi:hypothetical protein
MRGKTTVVLFVMVAACGKKSSEPAPADKTTPAKDAAAAKGPAPAAPAQLTLDGFSTPESVLYDEAGDQYFVSNIDGKPGDKDDKAFISRVTPDGKVELKWIDSAADGVTLNAPKGSAIVGDVLYVADIDTVRMFDRTSGVAKGEIAIDGATFLNDLAAAGSILWLTDTGLGADMSPNGTDAVYRIDTAAGNKVEKVVSGEELGNPNGIVASGDGATVVTFGSGEVYPVTKQGDAWAVGARQKLPKGQLDGIVVSGGRTLVSSWEDAAVYEVAADGSAKEVVTGVESPADIGLDSKRNRLLIPLFQKNQVVTHAL